jgi:hypothetical protein
MYERTEVMDPGLKTGACKEPEPFLEAPTVGKLKHDQIQPPVFGLMGLRSERIQQ